MTDFEVLDAFSCAGGTAEGWRLAGARVTAVDSDPAALEQNPADVKVVGDAIEYVLEHGRKFHLIAGGPPCQRWAAHGFRPGWPDLIGAFRDACQAVGVPYVIENVHSARRELRDPVLLCARMFGRHAYDTHPDAAGMMLILDRHRMFETSWPLIPPRHPVHRKTTGIGLVGVVPGEHERNALLVASGEGRFLTGRPHVAGGYRGARRDPWEAKYVRRGGYVPHDLDVVRTLLGTPWIESEQYLAEAIPPVYSRFIARSFLEHHRTTTRRDHA